MATCGFGTSACDTNQILLAHKPTESLNRQPVIQVADLILDIQQQENTIQLVATHSQALSNKMQRSKIQRSGKLVDGCLRTR